MKLNNSRHDQPYVQFDNDRLDGAIDLREKK